MERARDRPVLILLRAIERLRREAEGSPEADALLEALDHLGRHLQRPDAADAVTDAMTASERIHLVGLVDRVRGDVLSQCDRADLNAEEVVRALQELESLRDRIGLQRGGESLEALMSVSRGPDLIVELAHDLRSPLTSVLFLSEALRRGQSGPINELQHRQLGIIYSAALGLVSMAGDVIEMARGGDRLIDSCPSPFALIDLLDPISDLVQPMAEHKGIDLRIPPPPSGRFLGYPVALSRVLLNLTTNALKATEKGFVEILARQTVSERVEFSVRDSGSGIDEQTQRSLFEPFHLKPTGGMRIGISSSGLGLSICRRLVQAMGSTLHFETAPGQGTRFHFELALPPAAAM